MTPLEILVKANPNALILEPRDVYDAALVGSTDKPDDHWPRKTDTTVAIYDEELCHTANMAGMECDYDAANDWFQYNTSGGWYGENTPTFVSTGSSR